MKLPHRSLLSAVFAGVLAAAFLPSHGSAVEAGTTGVVEALQAKLVKSEVSGNGRDLLRLSLTNTSDASIRVTIPAGLIFKGQNGDRMVVLRAADLQIAAKSTAEAELPAAALSSQNHLGNQSFLLTTDSEQKLGALLPYLASSNDIPRATSQLVVLALLEDITFAKWQQFLVPQRPAESKAANDVINAIDALGILREIAPRQTFALVQDNELKLRALRHPVARTKAAQLYGLNVPEDPASPSAGAPNLKQLLHSQPGDNCPVCRMRERAGRGAGDF